MKVIYKARYLLVLLLLTGCATRVPAPINVVPPIPLTVAQVQSDLDAYLGQQIRWGGEIVRVENQAQNTWVEIVSRSLRNSGEPYDSGVSSGRFIASFRGFMDPNVYSRGKLLTIVGNIESGVRRPIGEFEYHFPVVDVTSFYLWPDKSQEPVYIYPLPPWYYDPWWPYYPRPPIPHRRKH